MSSDEETLKGSNSSEEDLDAQERTDRLMSMAEYREEIVAYLRQSEVRLCFKFICLSGHCCR